ncbi:putative membrane protein [Handroanthus impetiginosus]|uniref:Putative membrane protein n=1 Tax=Handroanthus impetiginosus TaxID=429701 RepID=A0A2G9I3B3_9LAMI|nr:putative membrane protein [Handroanthus impetiginosus]
MDSDSRSPPSDLYTNATAAAAGNTSILPTTTATDDTSSSRRRSGQIEWPTIDGPLGLSHEDSLAHARRYFKLGFLCLPFLWAINCFYFWPVLRNPHAQHSHPQLRRYLVGSATGFLLFTAILSAWALTFAIGGESLIGHVWEELVMYNVAEKYGLTGWI